MESTDRAAHCGGPVPGSGNEWLQMIITGAPVIIFSVDRDGIFTLSEGRGLARLGLVPGQVVGLSAFEVYAGVPSVCEALRGALEGCVTETRQVVNGVVFDTKYAPISNAEGDISGVVGVAIDKTDELRAEEALRESEERYRGLVENAPIGVVIHDEHAIRYVNEAAVRMLGGTRPGDIVGHDAGDFMDPAHRAASIERRRRLMQGDLGVYPAELELVRLDGQLLPVEVTGSRITDRGESVMLLGLLDLTDRKRGEEERSKAQRLESLGVLAGGIAHDFNNLLTAILGNVSLAQATLEPEHPVSTLLADAERASLRAKDLTRQLLTFAKGGAPVRRRVAIGNALREATALAVVGTNVTADVDAPDDLPLVAADEAQLVQVLHNLVLNAVQSMPAGGRVAVRAAATTVEPGSDVTVTPGPYVRVEVEDHGAGMGPETVARIFDPYFSTKPHGTGLGLTVAYSIVQRHGGHLSVESTPGVGTTFEVLLPVGGAVATAEPPALPKERAGVGKGRILVMDDDAGVRAIAAQMLLRQGYDVTLAAEGNELLDLFVAARDGGRPFDAVIVDLTVRGGMGGKEAISRLRAIDPDVTALVSSGYSDDPIMADYRAAGFDEVVPKPYTVEDLSRAIAGALARRR